MDATLMLSCAAAVAIPAARATAARVSVPANCFISVLRDAIGAGRRSRNYSMVHSYRTTWQKPQCQMPVLPEGGIQGKWVAAGTSGPNLLVKPNHCAFRRGM